MKLEGDNFRQKLNTQPIFEAWIAKVKAKNISIQDRLFTFEKRQKDGKVLLHLKVNFSPDVVTIFKEVSYSVDSHNNYLVNTFHFLKLSSAQIK